MATFDCSYCNFSCRQRDQDSQFFKHLINFHSNEPNFQVYCNHVDCNRSFKTIRALQKHWQRQHAGKNNELDLQEGDLEPQPNPELAEDQFDERSARKQLQLHTAKFLLATKESAAVSQTALDKVKDSTKALVSEYLDIIKHTLVAKIRDVQHDFQFSEDMDKLFDADSLYDGLETEHQQNAYYLKNFNLVEPTRITLGTRWKYVVIHGRRQLKRVTQYGYYVSVLKTIEALLQNSALLDEVDNPHQSQDGVYCDVMDGEYFKKHPIFSVDMKALQILGYFDDLEVSNPLGSKSKIHKIGVFYYVLGNLHPMYRSSLRAVQLVSICKTQDLKEYGLSKILGPFVDEVNRLTSDQGYKFNIGRTSRVFRGSVLLWTGDTLGSNMISGYKEGVGGALRICRHCMGTRQDTREKFRATEFQERDLESHRGYCAMIEDPNNATLVCERLSTTYGINGLSILQSIRYFDVCQCFPEDIMHILFEGIVPYEVKLILKYLIDERRCFTVAQLNELLESFDYGYMNRKDKPSPITRETLNSRDTKIKQSAAQMWCLFRFFPIILGKKIEEDLQHWQCLQKLWNIVQICTSPKIEVDDIALLRVLIEDHHKLFKHLYPDASIIPKLHYLIHVPDDIRRFGPPRNVWTMRFEAKHSLLKRLMTKNFKNVPKSLAFRHQRNMCWNLISSGQSATNYLYIGDKVGPGGYSVDLSEHTYADMICVAADMPVRPERFFGDIVKSVEIHGIEFRPECILRLEEMDVHSGESFYPKYGQVDQIIVWDDEKFFVVTLLEVVEFTEHLMAYEVQRTDCKEVWSYLKLPWHGVLHMITLGFKHYVVEKDTANVELL